MKKNAERSASPLTLSMSETECMTIADFEGHDESSGLTKREHFSGLAMQGLCMNINGSDQHIAREAVAIADALLKELDKRNKLTNKPVK